LNPIFTDFEPILLAQQKTFEKEKSPVQSVKTKKVISSKR